MAPVRDNAFGGPLVDALREEFNRRDLIGCMNSAQRLRRCCRTRSHTLRHWRWANLST